MIGGAEIHFADGRFKLLALFIFLDDGRGIKRAGVGDHARPDRELHVGVVGAPFRLVAELFFELGDEQFRERIFVLQGPIKVRRGVNVFSQLRTDLLGEERDLIGDHHLHLRRQAELLGLLHRQNAVAAVVDVDDNVGAGIGDVGQVLAEILGAERRHLIRHLRPAAVLGEEVVHRLGDGVAVGVVRRHERRLLVFAIGLQQHRADRVRGRLAVEALAKGIA